MNIACPTCSAWSEVRESRHPYRLLVCGNMHRFLTVETVMTQHLITPIELAERWRIHIKTLSNWRVQGRGPSYVKLGAGKRTRVLYRAEDVARYEAAGLHLADQEAAK